MEEVKRKNTFDRKCKEMGKCEELVNQPLMEEEEEILEFGQRCRP